MATKSEFVLKFADGTYHAVKRDSGWDTLVHVKLMQEAMKFDGYDYAVNYKNNESHLRHAEMTIVEMQYEIKIVDRGLVPIREPDWDDYDESYDRYGFENARSQVMKEAGEKYALSKRA